MERTSKLHGAVVGWVGKLHPYVTVFLHIMMMKPQKTYIRDDDSFV